jgi:curved DNA-binding protein CbpA
VSERNFYEVLEVEPAATARQIKEAYERAVQLIDGENVAGYLMLDEAGQRGVRAEIEEAYAVLSDPAQRAQYDAAQGTDPPKARRPRLRFLRPVEDSSKPEPAAPGPADPVEPPEAEPESESAAEADEPAVNGAYIRQLREAKGLSVAEIAKKTRVPKAYVAAIEAEDRENLPKAVFVRGFLTQIARQLGVDRARLADGYVRTVLKD